MSIAVLSRISRNLTIQIIAAMLIGGLLGWKLGSQAIPLGALGGLVIQLIKAVAAPLLFLAIVEAIITADIRWRDGARMLLIATINASLALLIGLSLANIFQPGLHLNFERLGAIAPPAALLVGKIDALKMVSGYVPTSWVQPFIDNLIISLVLLALLVGFALRRVRREQQARNEDGYRIIETAISSLLHLVTVILVWIVRLVPVAVFGVVAKAVGEFGFRPIEGLAWYVGIALVGITLHVAIVHQSWIVLVGRMRLRDFWRQARTPTIYALGANSSLATLPLTLTALDRLGVSRASSRLGACIGTNFNNDGIILYEGMAVILVAQAAGLDLSIAQQIFAAGCCLIAAIGVAGVPEAGVVSLSLVLATVGLPLEYLPLLLTVDWIIARARSFANVVSDMVVSIALERWRRI